MKPNILFLVVDSLRSDRCYGQKKSSVTPNLNSIIEKGILFSNSVSVAPSTSVSLASIFTGFFPFRIGMSDEKYEKLDSQIPNFINLMKKYGYTTYMSSYNINKILNLSVDFDLNFNLKNYRNYPSLFDGYGEKIVEQLSSNMKNPWFYYIHINDLHEPIIVPSTFNNSRYGVSQYDRMVSAIDHWLGKILQCIDTQNTLVVLTSDHGDYVRSLIKNGNEISLESSTFEKLAWKIGNKIPMFMGKVLHDTFSEKFQKTHSKNRSKLTNKLELSVYEKRILESSRMTSLNHLFDDLLIVPIVFFGEKISKNQVIAKQVRLIDIFPTIFDLCDLKYSDDIDGISLLSLINEKKSFEQPAYIESIPSIEGNDDKKIGIRTSQFKFIRSKKNPSVQELYDLSNDPYEENNIASHSRNITDKLNKILNDLLNKPKYRSEPTDKKDRKKIEDELKKLGYL